MTRPQEKELARRLYSGIDDAISGLSYSPSGTIINLDPHNGSYRLEKTTQFWGGFMLGRGWLLGDLYGEPKFIERLVSCTGALSELMDIRSVDTGFAGYFGLALGYELTADAEMRDRALTGAKRLAELFAPDARVFLTLHPEGEPRLSDSAITSVFCKRELLIDTAAVLDLLWWASRWVPEYRGLLVEHYKRTLDLGMVEESGRTHHALYFAPDGAAGRLHTHQGAGEDSRWTRAHGWAAIGFATAYGQTGLNEFREAAVRAASYFVKELGSRIVPPFDLDSASTNVPEDSCTTAIVLAAIERMRAFGIEVPSEVMSFSERALDGLLDHYLTPGGTLLHGCWGAIGDGPVDGVLPYGNYYLAEAVYRRISPDSHIWGLPSDSAVSS